MKSSENTRSNEIASPFTQLRPYVRDTQLTEELFAKYKLGTLFTEPTFGDASSNIVGRQPTTHRYFILSENARDLGVFSENPEWGLCVWEPSTVFKVIGLHKERDFSQITLLQIPDEYITFFSTKEFAPFEIELAEKADRLFRASLGAPVSMVLNDQDWLERVEYPFGLRPDGVWFDAWSHSGRYSNCVVTDISKSKAPAFNSEANGKSNSLLAKLTGFFKSAF